MVGLRRFGVGWGTVGLITAGFGMMPEGLADSFYLKTGDVVEGTVLEATRNTIILRAGGAVKPTGLGQIEKVVLDLADGGELDGEFVAWKDGVFEVRSEGVVVHVKDGQVIEEASAAKTLPEEVATVDATAEKTGVAAITPAPQSGSPKPTPPLSIAMQGLPELTMKGGKASFGRIIHATGSIVTLREHIGGVVPTSRAQIKAIRFVGEDGEIVEGQFVDWKDGVYRLVAEDREVLASLGDDAAAAGPPQVLLAQPANPEPDPELAKGPVVTAIDSADAAASPISETAPGSEIDENPQASQSGKPASQDLPVDDRDAPDLQNSTGAGGPVSETVVTGLVDSKAGLTNRSEEQLTSDVPDDGAPRMVEPKVAAVEEDGVSVLFEFHLDHPANRPLVILYAATDDTARAGEDFEAKSGVITFDPGSVYAEVRVPLIDDQQGEDSEQFHLFLSGDPETVQFRERQIPATINDND